MYVKVENLTTTITFLNPDRHEQVVCHKFVNVAEILVRCLIDIKIILFHGIVLADTVESVICGLNISHGALMKC